MNGDTAYDLVVIGSGVAGLSAAACARELGLSAVVLEKSANLGGGTSFSYGLIWAPRSDLAEAAGYADSREQILTYMRHLAGGIADEKKMTAFVDTVPDVIRLFERLGMTFQIIHGVTDHYYGIAPGGLPEGRLIEVVPLRGGELGAWQARTHLPAALPYAMSAEEMIRWGGMERASTWDAALMQQRRDDDLRGLGAGLVAQLLRIVLNAEVPIVAQCRAKHLVVENGRWRASQPKATARFARPKALATGSYENNPSIGTAYEGLPNCESPFEIDGNDGDGLIMGAEQNGDIHCSRRTVASAQLHKSIRPCPTARSRKPRASSGSATRTTMVVNRSGRRFADELLPRARAAHSRIRHRRAPPRQPPGLSDLRAQFWKKYGVGGNLPGGKIPASIVRASSPRSSRRNSASTPPASKRRWCASTRSRRRASTKTSHADPAVVARRPAR